MPAQPPNALLTWEDPVVVGLIPHFDHRFDLGEIGGINIKWIGCEHAGADNARAVADAVNGSEVILYESARNTTQGQPPAPADIQEFGFTMATLLDDKVVTRPIDTNGLNVTEAVREQITRNERRQLYAANEFSQTLLTPSSLDARIHALGRLVGADSHLTYSRDKLCASQVVYEAQTFAERGAKRQTVIQGAMHFTTAHQLAQAGATVTMKSIPDYWQYLSQYFIAKLEFIAAAAKGDKPRLTRTRLINALTEFVISQMDDVDLYVSATRVAAMSPEAKTLIASLPNIRRR